MTFEMSSKVGVAEWLCTSLNGEVTILKSHENFLTNPALTVSVNIYVG